MSALLSLEKTPTKFSERFEHRVPLFEEYLYYAAIQRRAEEVPVDVHDVISAQSLNEDQAERVNALRALRSASWASIFYLITTDVLGPFNAPFAISQVGWVPGTLTL